MFRGIDRMSPLSAAVSIATLAGIVMLVLTMAFMALEPPPISAPVSGPTRAGPNTNSGTDLECGAGAECGADNPAVRVAPTPLIGPKILP